MISVNLLLLSNCELYPSNLITYTMLALHLHQVQDNNISHISGSCIRHLKLLSITCYSKAIYLTNKNVLLSSFVSLSLHAVALKINVCSSIKFLNERFYWYKLVLRIDILTLFTRNLHLPVCLETFLNSTFSTCLFNVKTILTTV